MSCQKVLNVLVFVSLLLFTSATLPSPPYPYQHQYPSYPYQNNYQQIYPQYPNNYGQQFQPYPLNYPSYPTYPPIPNQQSQNYYQGQNYGVAPQQTQFSSTIPPQGGVYPAPFPYMPTSIVQTPYGIIPVEIIDIDLNEDNVVNGDTAILPTKEITSENTTQPIDRLNEVSTNNELKKNIEISSKPIKTSSVITSDPQQTVITRTFDGNNVEMDVQTKSPLSQQNEEEEVDK